MSQRKIDILKHMLGVSEQRPPNRWGFRNFFAADPDSDDDILLSEMVKDGIVILRTKDPSEGLNYYHATDAGKGLVGAYKKEQSQ